MVQNHVLLAALVVLPATAAAQTMPTAQRRDSAGVAIVEYATIKSTLPAFRVAPALLADVGGLRDDPKDEIEGRTGYEVAVRLTDGRVAVAENYTVRVLDPGGKFVRLLGGRGGGPGEFNSQIVAMCLTQGDTLIVRDGRRSVSHYDRAGNHVVSAVADGTGFGSCGPDGSVLTSTERGDVMGRGRSGVGPAKTPEERARELHYAELWRLDRYGKRLDSIGVFLSYKGPPFGIVSQVFAVAMLGDRVAVGTGTNEIRIHSLAGKLLSIIRWRDPLIRVTPEIADALAAARIPTNDPNRAARIAQTRAMPHPETLPGYSGFFVDRAKRLWVRDAWPLPGTTTSWNIGWTVFAEDGTWIGRYTPPGGEGVRAMVTDAGNDFVVVRMRNPDEGVRVIVQSVSLARPAARD